MATPPDPTRRIRFDPERVARAISIFDPFRVDVYPHPNDPWALPTAIEFRAFIANRKIIVKDAGKDARAPSGTDFSL